MAAVVVVLNVTVPFWAKNPPVPGVFVQLRPTVMGKFEPLTASSTPAVIVRSLVAVMPLAASENVLLALLNVTL